MRHQTEATFVDQHIGRQVQLHRKALGMSRLQLCGAIDTTHSQLKRYERGEDRIPPGVLKSICVALQIRPRRLFEDMEILSAGEALGPKPRRLSPRRPLYRTRKSS